VLLLSRVLQGQWSRDASRPLLHRPVLGSELQTCVKSSLILVRVSVTYGRGSVLLWRRCDTLCTSGFVDDIIFSRSGPYGSDVDR